jgi:succinate dehydrogenase/fumarate reductase flavoprotein subunit
MSRIKIVGAVAGGALVFLAGWVARGWRADKTMAEMVAEAESRASAAYAAEALASRKALREREAEIERLTVESAALAGKLKEAYENDPEYRSWADTALPDSVLGLLR